MTGYSFQIFRFVIYHAPSWITYYDNETNTEFTDDQEREYYSTGWYDNVNDLLEHFTAQLRNGDEDIESVLSVDDCREKEVMQVIAQKLLDNPNQDLFVYLNGDVKETDESYSDDGVTDKSSTDWIKLETATVFKHDSDANT